MAANGNELISARNLRWENGRYVVGEFNDLGQPTSRPVTNKQGEEIRLQLVKAEADLDRYARWAQANPEIPAPTTIPVEISH